jgi:hypothetical protein
MVVENRQMEDRIATIEARLEALTAQETQVSNETAVSETEVIAINDEPFYAPPSRPVEAIADDTINPSAFSRWTTEQGEDGIYDISYMISFEWEEDADQQELATIFDKDHDDVLLILYHNPNHTRFYDQNAAGIAIEELVLALNDDLEQHILVFSGTAKLPTSNLQNARGLAANRAEEVLVHLIHINNFVEPERITWAATGWENPLFDSDNPESNENAFTAIVRADSDLAQEVLAQNIGIQIQVRG